MATDIDVISESSCRTKCGDYKKLNQDKIIMTTNLGRRQLLAIDALVEAGYGCSRSEIMRVALNQFIDKMIDIDEKYNAVINYIPKDDEILVDGRIFHIKPRLGNPFHPEVSK
jgi:Arc/MetJ-type ribon-helix-helix transcriptional regulator